MNKIIFAVINENGNSFYLVSAKENLNLNLTVFENPKITRREEVQTEELPGSFRGEVRKIFDNQLNTISHGFYGETLSEQRIELFFQILERLKKTEAV